MTPVKLSAQADADLRGVHLYIGRDNPGRALSFVKELRDKCRAIGERPMSFPDRSDWKPGLRSSLHHPYHIIFRVESDRIEILRIVHGARDIPTLL